jgi:hypothetical protein
LKVGCLGEYHDAILTVDTEKPEPESGFGGSIAVENIEIMPEAARALLMDLIQQRIEGAMADALALDYRDEGVRVDL